MAKQGVLIASPANAGMDRLYGCLQDCLDKSLQDGWFPVPIEQVGSLDGLLYAISTDDWSAVIALDGCETLPPSHILDLLKDRAPDLPLIVVADDIAASDAVGLMKAGAADVIDQDNFDKLLPALRRASAAHHSRRHQIDHPGVSQVLAAAVFRSASEAIMVTDQHNRIQAVNPAFSRMTGYHPEEVIGRDGDFCRAPGQVMSAFRDRNQVVAERGSWQGELWLRRKEGEVDFTAWASVTVLADEKGQARDYVTILSDMTERKRDQEKIWYQAHFDQLTGLANRSHFFDRLPHALRLSLREERPLALLFVDLDYFKVVNDSLGHRFGDLLLQQVADRMMACVRDTDMVARIGGDEFAILLTSAVSRDGAAHVADKILKQLKAPFDLQGQQAFISASIGIALFPDDTANAEDLLHKADRAMYATKNDGRNGYCFYRAELATSPLVAAEVNPVSLSGHGIYAEQPVPMIEGQESPPTTLSLKAFTVSVTAALIVLVLALLAVGLVDENRIRSLMATDEIHNKANANGLPADLGDDLLDLNTASGPEAATGRDLFDKNYSAGNPGKP